MTTDQALSLPVASSERAESLDALRGIALFGVCIVNLVTAFRVSLFEQFLPAPPQLPLDHAVARIITIGLEFKAFSLFAFLFGVGLEAQRERTIARGKSFAPYAMRRLSLLLAMGLTHLFLIWNGDILTLYALTGLAVAPVLGLRMRYLLPLSLALFVVQLLPVPWPNPFSSLEDMTSHIHRAREVYRGGSFTEILAFRVHEVRSVAALLFWIFPRTLALHVLGACAWRGGIFRGERRVLVRVVAVLGLATGGTCMWLVDSGAALGSFREAASGWGAILLALGYGACVIAAFEKERAASVLSLVAPLGRMALTNYLTQSIVLGALFYGYGLGLFGQLGVAQAAEIGVGLYVLQAVLSASWLKRHRFGPVEWLWRSFTYRAWQPMRR